MTSPGSAASKVTPRPRAWMIVPASAHRFDGVRDFAAHLGAALGPAQEIAFITTADDAAPIPGARTLSGWGALGALEPAPHVIYVNYLPQAWLRRDTFSMLRALTRLRAAGARVIVIIHEYQIDPARTLKRTAGRRVLKSLARAFARRADALVTTHGFVAGLARADGLDRLAAIATIPVGSNIDAAADRDHNAARGVVMFGQPAGMDPSMTTAAVRAAAEQGHEVVWCCRSAQETSAWLERHGIPAAGIRIAEGLQAGELSHTLARASIAVAPIDDGVSTRRTTVAAFLQHALPVAGTDGRTTDALLRGSGAFALAALGSPSAMGDAVTELLRDESRRRVMSSAARVLFETELAWPRIAARYLELAA